MYKSVSPPTPKEVLNKKGALAETNNDLFDAAFENKMCVVSDAVRVTAKAELL